MIRNLLPVGIAVEESAIGNGPIDDVVTISTVEARFVESASEKRKQEFAIGRACARRAIRVLGGEPSAIPVGGHGEPIWPPYLVGSITHSSRTCIAAIGLAEDFLSIGIDAESNVPLSTGSLDLISSVRDEGFLRQYENRGNQIAWDTLLFSIKETVFKTWFPVTKVWLGFDEVSIRLIGDDDRFVAEIEVEKANRHNFPTRIFGRFASNSETLYTAIAIGK